jgi:hypothetical protein
VPARTWGPGPGLCQWGGLGACTLPVPASEPAAAVAPSAASGRAGDGQDALLRRASRRRRHQWQAPLRGPPTIIGSSPLGLTRRPGPGPRGAACQRHLRPCQCAASATRVGRRASASCALGGVASNPPGGCIWKWLEFEFATRSRQGLTCQCADLPAVRWQVTQRSVAQGPFHLNPNCTAMKA